MKHLLVIDDQAGSRESIRAIFSKNFNVSAASSCKQGLQILSSNKIDLLLLDILMPDQDGLSFLKEAREVYPDLPVIMLSASTAPQYMLEALRLGAADYIQKPFDVADIRKIVQTVLEDSIKNRRLQVLDKTQEREFPLNSFIGESHIFRKVLSDIQHFANQNQRVLIQGEGGSGKEMAAKLYHSLSSLKDEPFIAIRNTSLPDDLLEEDLFGFRYDMQSNEKSPKLGYFDLAGSGIIYIEEIGELSSVIQEKIVQVLDTGTFYRLESDTPIPTEIQIIASTSMDLEQATADGHFSAELYQRLRDGLVKIPPLRERKEDIPLLVYYYLNYFQQRMGSSTKTIDAEAMDTFREYYWPGNITELKNVIERLMVTHQGTTIRVENLPAEFRSPSTQMLRGDNKITNFKEAVNAFERELIVKALTEANGTQAKAAELLGTTRRILNYRIKQLDIKTTAE